MDLFDARRRLIAARSFHLPIGQPGSSTAHSANWPACRNGPCDPAPELELVEVVNKALATAAQPQSGPKMRSSVKFTASFIMPVPDHAQLAYLNTALIRPQLRSSFAASVAEMS